MPRDADQCTKTFHQLESSTAPLKHSLPSASYTQNVALAEAYRETLSEAMRHNELIRQYANGIADDLNPLRVQVSCAAGVSVEGVQCKAA